MRILKRMGIFGKKIQTKPDNGFHKIIEGFSSTFMPFGADKLQSDTFLSAAQTNANHRSKLKLTHRFNERERNDFRHVLQLRPNPIMNSISFLESLSLDYDTYNNAFIFVDRDRITEGPIRALWRISPNAITIGVDESTNGNELMCRFTIQGATYTVPFSNICHIGRTITKDELFGDDNSAINKLLGIINTNYQGIEAAIKTSGLLRYVVEYKDKVDERKLRELEKYFTENILNPLKGGGVKYTDIASSIRELNPARQVYSNYAEQGLYEKKVHSFLGVSEKIINGTNTDNEMMAYYERTVDTFALKLGQELTYKIFTPREIQVGNEITAMPNRLAFMSMQHRLNIARLAHEKGMLTYGQFADLILLDISEEKRNKEMPVSQNYQSGDAVAEYEPVAEQSEESESEEK